MEYLVRFCPLIHIALALVGDLNTHIFLVVEGHLNIRSLCDWYPVDVALLLPYRIQIKDLGVIDNERLT
jgi:hypothetical protein